MNKQSNKRVEDMNTTKHYSDTSFWMKVGRWASTAGKTLLTESIAMWYAMQDEDTPMWAKAVIAGALGYFILPVDLLPDPIFVDDAAVVAQAFMVVRMYVKDEHQLSARAKVGELLGV